MLPIQQDLTPYNHYNYNNPVYIVIHDTGNYNDTAKNNATYFNGGNRGASANYFVDETSIIQIILDQHGSWHCGDGHGKYGISNTNSIGIELCNTNGHISERTLGNARDLVLYLMNKHGITQDYVARHYDASRKICPQNMSQNNWELWHKFKKSLSVPSSHIKIDGGGTLVNNIPSINLIIREFSSNIVSAFGIVDSDKEPSWAFNINPQNKNYTQLKPNANKVISKRTNTNGFTPGGKYKITVNGYDKNSNLVATTQIVLTSPTIPSVTSPLYKVQVGAFRNKEYAQNLVDKLKSQGHNPFIVKE